MHKQLCPICKSPARWLALLDQEGEIGKHIKRTITETVEKLLSRASVSLGCCSLVGNTEPTRLRHASRRFSSPAKMMRVYRESARKLGLCTNCRKRQAKPGCAQCATCQKERAKRKRMARRIGTKTCPCGNPAVNIRSGEYVCASCLMKETA